MTYYGASALNSTAFLGQDFLLHLAISSRNSLQRTDYLGPTDPDLCFHVHAVTCVAFFQFDSLVAIVPLVEYALCIISVAVAVPQTTVLLFLLKL